MIRPELRALLARHAELIVSGGVAIAGIWVASRGGWFFAVIGAAMLTVGAILALGAWRRRAFSRPVSAPGVVEVDEGAIRYFGAQHLGGEIGLRDLAEIRLLRLRGQAHWRLRSTGGQAILIPADAAGAEALAHAFAALPGMDLGAVARALQTLPEHPQAVQSVWRKA